MKGIIFTEFMELVEEKFGLEMLDKVLEASGDEGVYTSVGSYDHGKLVTLIVNLSKESGVSPELLQQVFGESVFRNLYKSVPETSSMDQCKSTFQFIRHVEDYIHTEVKKLYPDATPPSFEFISETETEMIFDYRSARCMGNVCLGLIKGCANYYQQKLEVEMDKLDDPGKNVRFSLRIV